jgi:hypothetical protein
MKLRRIFLITQQAATVLTVIAPFLRNLNSPRIAVAPPSLTVDGVLDSPWGLPLSPSNSSDSGEFIPNPVLTLAYLIVNFCIPTGLNAWTETHSHVALKANPNEAFEIFAISAASSVIYFFFIPEV